MLCDILLPLGGYLSRDSTTLNMNMLRINNKNVLNYLYRIPVYYN